MRRSLAAVVCGLLLVAAAPAAGAKKLTIRWYGQSYFQITTTAGTRVVIDPHAIDAFFSERNKVSADLVLCSHTHNDHTQVEVLENWDPKKVKRINGVKDEKGDGKRTDWNHVDEKFKDVRVRTVALYHDDMRGMVRGKNAAFVLEADGLRIVHLGDLGHKLTPAQVKHLLKDGPIDVLMVPVGGVYTINGSEAKAVVEQLKPKRYILPMHYGINGVYDDLLTTDEFLDEQPRDSVVRKRPSENQLDITPGTKPPAAPQIVVLGWGK